MGGNDWPCCISRCLRFNWTNYSWHFLMSPLSGFLAVIVFFTATLVAYLTKQFQNENLNYLSSDQMKNTNTKIKTIEKEKVVAETLNVRFAMLGLIAAVGAYLTTGQIIPGNTKKVAKIKKEKRK